MKQNITQTIDIEDIVLYYLMEINMRYVYTINNIYSLISLFFKLEKLLS